MPSPGPPQPQLKAEAEGVRVKAPPPSDTQSVCYLQHLGSIWGLENSNILGFARCKGWRARGVAFFACRNATVSHFRSAALGLAALQCATCRLQPCSLQHYTLQPATLQPCSLQPCNPQLATLQNRQLQSVLGGGRTGSNTAAKCDRTGEEDEIITARWGL